MSGHLDIRVNVKAPLDLTWRLGNSREDDQRHVADDHTVVAEDSGRNSYTLRIASPPDAAGRVWNYYVERVIDDARHVVYARRWGNPHFRYSTAIWIYREVPGGTEIRCVQDFEMTDDSPVDDSAMGEVLRKGTERALAKTAEVMAAAAAS
jgi:aromatase